MYMYSNLYLHIDLMLSSCCWTAASGCRSLDVALDVALAVAVAVAAAAAAVAIKVAFIVVAFIIAGKWRSRMRRRIPCASNSFTHLPRLAMILASICSVLLTASIICPYCFGRA